MQGDWSSVVRRVAPSVVTVIAYTSERESLGTGFYISSDGKVATNLHVLGDAARIVIRHENGRTFTVQRVLVQDHQTDLAILQTSNRSAHPLTLGDSDKVQRGQEICVIGSALGVLEGSITTGIVSGVRNFDGLRTIQVSAPISPGNSGSPVLNRRGEVIGITNASLIEGQNLNLAVTINYLKRLMGTLRPASTSKASAPAKRFIGKRVVVRNSVELRQALAQISAGGEIVLQAGEYRFNQPIVIIKPLSLIGAGMEKTVLILTGDKFCIQYRGSGLFVMRNLAVRYEGTNIVDAVSINAGQVQIIGCAVSGAARVEGKIGSAGISTYGSARVLVQDSLIFANELGIAVCDKSFASVQYTECQENTDGIVVFNEARADVRFSTCKLNRAKGIVAQDKARLYALSNTCEENGTSGIWVTEKARATLRRNACRFNSFHGIEVSGESSCTAEENICENNYYSGIVLFNKARGEIRNNNCRNNGLHGIAAENESYLVADTNLCENNRENGISNFGSATGVIRRNRCLRNGLHGISTNEFSDFVIENNFCESNSSSGIYLSGNFTGTISGNNCKNNEYGIYVEKNAAPTVKNTNRWENNRVMGYWDWRNQ